MDEYFCPECGAILNDQYGFDPSNGTWTCTSCDQLLMDDDVYEGDIFEGVAWYCDECGDLLNRQSGFSDIYDTWTCTECYYINGTTEEDIINNSVNKFICPNCYNTLNDQWYFNKNNYDWTCTYCDTHLHHNYSDDPYYIVEEEDDEDDERESYASQHRNSSARFTAKKEHKLSNWKLRIKRIKAFFLSKGKITIDYDYHELLQRNVAEVHTILYNKAFSNIKIISVKDIYIDSPYKEGAIEQILVDGNSFFEAFNKFQYNTEIIITYHEKKEITIPFSANSMYKLNYVEVSHRLKSLGFTEIYECPIQDLKIGWLIKDGSVEKVSMAGDNSFKKDSVYQYDTKIVIEYHTFKSKK